MSKEYKAEEFEYFVYQETGRYEMQKGKDNIIRRQPILEKVVINFEDIEQLDLENRGERVPFTHKHVINTPLYLMYYWSPIIGDRACFLYLQLLTYCREDRDFLWDKLKEIAVRNKISSHNTLTKYLDVLEKHNFIVIVHRLNKKDNNRQTSPIIKVRQSIPLLSKELYEQLPERLKQWHDDFMDRYGKSTKMPEETYKSKETVNELIDNGQVLLTSKTRQRIQELIAEENAIDYIKSKLQFSNNLKTTELHELLASHSILTKPAYDTFFSDSLVYYDDELNCIDFIVKPIGQTLLTESRNEEFYKSKLYLIIHHLYGLQPEEYDLNIYTFEEYMKLLMRKE